MNNLSLVQYDVLLGTIFTNIHAITLYHRIGIHQEVIVCFVGEIVDHHCLSFLFISIINIIRKNSQLR
jgi:hypothetical protein